jgi:DNA-binding response OmpR family regulator
LRKYNKALIVDDDVDLCLTLKSVLAATISDIQFAHTLESGKRLLPDFKPEVIFLDNNLPDGEGVNLIKEIRDCSPSSFIVFITAIDSAKGKALEAGVDVFLEKPLTYTSVLKALGNLEQSKQES